MAVLLRPLTMEDLPVAEGLFRQAFCKFLQLPDRALGDRTFFTSRVLAQPQTAIAAELDGVLIGAVVGQTWGSLCILGPVVVRPTGWTGGAGALMAKRVMELASERFGSRGFAGFTFSQSPAHLEFMRRIEVWPRMLNATLTRSTAQVNKAQTVQRYSTLAPTQKVEALARIRELTEQLYPGLSLELEITKVLEQKLGDVVLLDEGSKLEGFAVVHHGPGSEAEKGSCQAKFGMVRPGPGAAAAFARLVEAIEVFAAQGGVAFSAMGVNQVHQAAFRFLNARGYQIGQVGVALHHRNAPYYQLPGDHLFVLDDWR